MEVSDTKRVQCGSCVNQSVTYADSCHKQMSGMNGQRIQAKECSSGVLSGWALTICRSAPRW